LRIQKKYGDKNKVKLGFEVDLRKEIIQIVEVTLKAGLRLPVEETDFEADNFRLIYNSFQIEDLGGFGLVGIIL